MRLAPPLHHFSLHFTASISHRRRRKSDAVEKRRCRQMSGCFWDCDGVLELGPPADFVWSIPPPPIPAFLREPVALLRASNGSCDLCAWAADEQVQLLELSRNLGLVDQVWYLVVAAAAAMAAILMSAIVLFAAIKCRENKMKGSIDRSAVSINNNNDPIDGQHHHGRPKALWSSIYKRPWDGRRNGGNYFLQHHLISSEKSTNDTIDYGSVDFTRPVVLGSSHDNGVYFTPDKGYAYYTNPDGSFDNNGFDDAEVAAAKAPTADGVTSAAGGVTNAGGMTRAPRISRRHLPQIRTTNSGCVDHLVIKQTPRIQPGFLPHLPMVTQIHVDRNVGIIRSTALV